MTRLFIVVLFISFLFCSSAQTHNLQAEIENSNNTPSILISKGRALLLDKFLSKDIDKTAELEKYLSTSLSNDDYFALYPIEQWLIKYWTKDYKQLINCIRQYDSINSTLQKKVHPQSDNLYTILRERTCDQRQQLINSILESSIPKCSTKFKVTISFFKSGSITVPNTSKTLSLLISICLNSFYKSTEKRKSIPTIKIN